MFPDWNWTLIAVSASFHSTAILFTLFRLWYRWYTAHLWWDDAWAVLAFLADIASLIATVIEQPIPGAKIPRFFSAGNWIVSFAYPTLMWAARISILTSIVRVSRPEGMLRRVAHSIGILFGLMGIAMLGQRLQGCLVNHCLMTRVLFITQTTADCVADVLLSALPIWFLRSVKLSRKRRILICSALSASMVITIVTVVELVAIFSRSMTSGSIIFEHVKVACSMMVCNLLVIATFVYRILRKDKTGFEDFAPEARSMVEFTTVDLAQGGFSQETSKVTSSAPSRIQSSTWSFRGGSRSKTSGSVTVAVSRVDTVSAVRSEDEHSQSGLSMC